MQDNLPARWINAQQTGKEQRVNVGTEEQSILDMIGLGPAPDVINVAVAFHGALDAVDSLNQDTVGEPGAVVSSTRAGIVQTSRSPKLDALSREKLYALVWATPIEQLAECHGISIIALKKRCVTRNIPTHPRGYWQRKQKGYVVPEILLPTERTTGQG